MARRSVRCPRCGLAQFSEATCRGCGTALLASPSTPPRPSFRSVHPLQAIWLSPRATIRALVADDPTRGVVPLTWLTGFGFLLAGLASRTDDRFPFAFAAPAALVGGPLLNFAVVFTSAFLTTWTGRALGGRATAVELRAALAWAEAPLLLFLVLWIPRVIAPGAFELGLDLVELGLVLWAEAIAVVLVAEVHGFTIRRSALAVFLAWALKLALLVGLLLAVVPDEPAPADAPDPRASSSRPS